MATPVERQCSVYRALLRLYPPAFRRSYGDPMVQLFGDRLRDVGTRAWLRTLPDLVRTASIERTEATMNHLGPTARVLLLAFAVVAGTAAVMGAGGGVMPVVAVAVVAVLIAKRQVFAALPGGERAPLRHAVVQAWWAPVAALIGVVMLLAGVGTFFEAHNLGGRIFGTSLLLAFGAAMLFGLVRRPFARQSGNTIILLATVPLFPFFWLVVPPVMGIVVWAGVLTSGFADRPVAPTTG
jgi:hypothetical protein